PLVLLARPVVTPPRRAVAEAVATGPASPARLVRVVHARRHQVEEGHGVTLLLRMGGVGGIERAERAVVPADIPFQVEAAGGRGQRGEAVVPAAAVALGAEGVHPE